jgi:23S rRNA G2445 N2-methylase RlmL
MNKYNFVIIFFLTVSLQAQKRILRGKVVDSLQNPVEFANIMAKPVDNNNPFVFAVTDEKGIFEVRLKNKQSYKVSVSFMGYKTYKFTVDSLQIPDFVFNFVV